MRSHFLLASRWNSGIHSYAHSRPRTAGFAASIAVLTCSLVALAPVAAHAGTNLILDGDFASCEGHVNTPFASNSGAWTASGGYGCNAFGGAPNGANEIATGGEATATQSFADTAGATYTVSAFIEASSADPYITIDSVAVITADFLTSNSGWIEYTATFVGTGTDTIGLISPSPPGFDSFFGVSVTTAVPEPASLALFCVSAAALGMARRRRYD